MRAAFIDHLVHNFSESGEECFPLCACANRNAQEIWQGREMRPTLTPRLRKALMIGLTSRRSSIIMKFACDGM